nr:nitrile-specifier protein 5 [Quercus suber]
MTTALDLTTKNQSKVRSFTLPRHKRFFYPPRIIHLPQNDLKNHHHHVQEDLLQHLQQGDVVRLRHARSLGHGPDRSFGALLVLAQGREGGQGISSNGADVQRQGNLEFVVRRQGRGRAGGEERVVSLVSQTTILFRSWKLGGVRPLGLLRLDETTHMHTHAVPIGSEKYNLLGVPSRGRRGVEPAAKGPIRERTQCRALQIVRLFVARHLARNRIQLSIDMSATWTKIAHGDQLQRSSHSVAAIGSELYIVGGELKPRQPRDNDVHKLNLSLKATSTPTKIASTPSSPSPRVGAALTSLGGKLYMFSGRGGEAMSAVDEQGSFWIFDPSNSNSSDAWTLQQPSSAEFPEARSYHCLTNDGTDAIYLHAGCPASGRLSDFWRFRVSTAAWEPLASAPGAPRGGASIAYAAGKVYRMNGFDGTQEVGGSVDVYDVASERWTSVEFAADGVNGPGPRSVAALLAVDNATSDETLLVTLFGESDPSSLGHMGAGKMLTDVWAFAPAHDAWKQLQAQGPTPQARGWFDADVASIDGRDCVVVAGGLGEANERLDDVWVLTL